MISRLVRFFGDAKFTSTRRWLLAAVLVLVVISDFLVAKDHGHFFWDAIPGWAAFMGLVSCVDIIFVSKFLGHQGRIMRREDYYD